MLDTREYERARWTTPRGEGTWLFRRESGELLSVYGTYTSASREARRLANRGERLVVLP
jgi:hypothetical protein